MVSRATLCYLSSQRLRDAKALLTKGRNGAAIYLMGYSLEYALKNRVMRTLGFTKGFPETSADFALYTAQVAQFNSVNTGMALTRIHEIKNHNLQQLLQYSGAESRIISSHYASWLIVKEWTPGNRYRIRRYSGSKAKNFLTAAFILLKQLAN